MLSPSEGRDPVLSAVTLIAGIIVALTFLFGFGNVFTLELRLGVPVWVAPAVDRSVVGLLVAIRSLSMTLALNVGSSVSRGSQAELATRTAGPAQHLLVPGSGHVIHEDSPHVHRGAVNACLCAVLGR